MSATPPSTLEGTEAPNPFEVLWDRYRSLILTIVGALLLALLGNTAWTYMEQREQDEKWAAFNTSIGLSDTYVDVAKGRQGLSESLKDLDYGGLEEALGAADEGQKPYYHLAIARKAMLEKDWDRAEQQLAAIESGFPKHALVMASAQAVQTRDEKKRERDAPPATELEFVDAVEGSVISFMRKEIADGRAFTIPAAYSKPEIPEDAIKVKFTFGDTGSFTMALFGGAEKHREKLLELVNKDDGAHFKGIAVDEIHRPTDRALFQEMAIHFGFESSKDDDRTKWTTTEPSNHVVDFEDSGLSHFPGAVATRPEAEGKSCADRLWISVDDHSNMDGERVVLGYVVEGMDVLRDIASATLSAQEEDQGRGRPIENIRITAVEVLK